jgi:hypothetical protein
MNSSVDAPPRARDALAGLKAFQRRTVEYAFRRLYLDEDSTHRFLVADEVGLGKTMVARGVIAKAVEHLWRSVDRIDVVYVCSNADIARQNINRLRLDKSHEFARASRATLLPIELRDMAKRRVNYVSMTPGTSLEPRGGRGIAQERALMFHLLREHWKIPEKDGLGLFRGGVKRANFKWWVQEWMAEQSVDAALHAGFLQELDRLEALDRNAGKPTLRERALALASGEEAAESDEDPRQGRRSIIAELRAILGRTCITALRPDLVILDEFQRFKHLLDPKDDAAELARSLFDYADTKEQRNEAVRVLLLSATPYKMYSLQHEQENGESDHYEDFVATYDFLAKHAPEDNWAMRGLLKDYRSEILNLRGGEVADLRSIKAEIENRLRRVMSRTERLTATNDRSGMLREIPSSARLEPSDVRQYLTAAGVAKALDHGEIVEYWKSAPYLLNFMDEYELKKDLRQAIDAGKSGSVARALAGASSGLLPWEDIAAYRAIDPANSRLRSLLNDTVDTGVWKLLWLPPSLPYYRPSGPFATLHGNGVTKRLVFSSWKVVPKVIASVVSHEVERRMMQASYGSDGEVTIQNTTDGRKKITALLRFARADGRLTGMPVLGLIYPSTALAGAFDPAHQGSSSRSADHAVGAAADSLRPAVDQAVKRWSSGGEVDERWYWACPILLDLLEDPAATKRFWFQGSLPEAWSGEQAAQAEEGHEEPETAWAEHVRQAQDLLKEACRPNNRPLGQPPKDLVDAMAKACLGNPAVAALRSLARVLSGSTPREVDIRLAAGRVAWRIRNLFNLPEVIALVRGLNGAEPYWMRVIEYAVDGCLQAVLDEYAHVLKDSLGVGRMPSEEAAAALAEEMVKAIGLRTAAVGVDDIRVDAKTQTVSSTKRSMRARFAARFGQQQGEDADDRDRAGQVRAAFNSPFWPFILASTSVGQEGLDFHHYCHAIVHWNLPSNPVDLEQREGRIHRYKGHAVRKNIATTYGDRACPPFGDRWRSAFEAAASEHANATNELKPFWVFPTPDGAVIERHVPALPLSRDADKLVALRSALALYRMVFGQPRQDELVKFLQARLSASEIEQVVKELRIDLEPPSIELAETSTAHDADEPETPVVSVAQECDLFAAARDAVLAHPSVIPLGEYPQGQGQPVLWPFVPASWPIPLPPLRMGGRETDRSFWLAMWLDRVRTDQFGLMLLLSPMSDQPLRMKIVERLLRDPGEFGIHREHLINVPGIPKQWVFLANRVIAPLSGHGLDSVTARPRMDAAIDEYVARFAKVGEAIEPLLA